MQTLKPSPIVFSILGLILAPTVSANYNDVRTWYYPIQTITDGDGDTPSFAFTLNKPHDFDATDTKNWIHIQAHYRASGAATTANDVTFFVQLDGADITGCEWRIVVGTATPAMMVNREVSLDCLVPTSLLGAHTIETRVVVNIGANPTTTSTISFTAYQTQVVTMINQTLETLETAFPLLLFGVLVTWAEIRREWDLYALATFAGIVAIFGTWNAIVTARYILAPLVFLVGIRFFQSTMEQKENEG